MNGLFANDRLKDCPNHKTWNSFNKPFLWTNAVLRNDSHVIYYGFTQNTNRNYGIDYKVVFM